MSETNIEFKLVNSESESESATSSVLEPEDLEEAADEALDRIIDGTASGADYELYGEWANGRSSRNYAQSMVDIIDGVFESECRKHKWQPVSKGRSVPEYEEYGYTTYCDELLDGYYADDLRFQEFCNGDKDLGYALIEMIEHIQDGVRRRSNKAKRREMAAAAAAAAAAAV
jgi:hypothetical protein